MDSIELLLNGIIRQTAEDYVKSLKFLIKAKNKKFQSNRRIEKARLMLRDCIRFFTSEGFKAFAPSVDGNEFMHKLNQHVKNELLIENVK